MVVLPAVTFARAIKAITYLGIDSRRRPLFELYVERDIKLPGAHRVRHDISQPALGGTPDTHTSTREGQYDNTTK